jgi:hypothetical protein
MAFTECVAGKKFSRWGLVALHDNWLQYAEKNGVFRGYVHLIPVRKDNDTSHVYGSIDVLVKDFPKKVKPVGAEKHSVERLFDAWYHEALKHKPPQWEGFVIGDDGEINAANGRSGASSSQYYEQGKNLGGPQEFSTTEPELEKLLYAEDVRAGKLLNDDDRHQEGKGLFECSVGRNKAVYLLSLPLSEELGPILHQVK